MVGLPFFVAGPYCAPPASRQRVYPTTSSSRSSRTSTSAPKYARMIATRVRPSFLVASVLSRDEREMYGWEEVGASAVIRPWKRPTSGRANCGLIRGSSPLPSYAARRVSDGRAYHTHSPDDRQTPMYIDPAAGSLILQVLIAGVLAVATTFKSARQSVARALRDLFGSRKEK